MLNIVFVILLKILQKFKKLFLELSQARSSYNLNDTNLEMATVLDNTIASNNQFSSLDKSMTSIENRSREIAEKLKKVFGPIAKVDLPKFDGRNPISWLWHYKLVAAHSCLSETEMCRRLITCMEGEVNTWYMTKFAQPFTDFNVFEIAFRERYTSNGISTSESTPQQVKQKSVPRTQSYSALPICENQQKKLSFSEVAKKPQMVKTNLSVVKIRIGPYAVEGLMDFGAGLTAIDAKLATLLSREWYAWEGSNLQLADGRSMKPIGVIQTDIELDCKVMRIPVAIVKGLGVDVKIGIDFMIAMGSISMDDNRKCSFFEDLNITYNLNQSSKQQSPYDVTQLEFGNEGIPMPTENPFKGTSGKIRIIRMVRTSTLTSIDTSTQPSLPSIAKNQDLFSGTPQEALGIAIEHRTEAIDSIDLSLNQSFDIENGIGDSQALPPIKEQAQLSQLTFVNSRSLVYEETQKSPKFKFEPSVQILSIIKYVLSQKPINESNNVAALLPDIDLTTGLFERLSLIIMPFDRGKSLNEPAGKGAAVLAHSSPVKTNRSYIEFPFYSLSVLQKPVDLLDPSPLDSMADVVSARQSDAFCSRYRDILSTKNERLIARKTRNFVVVEDTLYWIDRTGNEKRYLLVIPLEMVPVILETCHDKHGHFGVYKTYSTIRLRFFWKDMFRMVKDHVVSCDECQRRKVGLHKSTGLYQPIPVATRVFETFSIDLLGATPESDGYKYCLCMVDQLSHMLLIEPLRETSGDTILEVTKNRVFLKFGFL